MSQTNSATTAYVFETVEGITPATPAFKEIPVTSNSLIKNMETAVSNAINDVGMDEDLIITKKSVSGDLGYELSYDAYKPIISEVVLPSPVIAETGVTVTDTTTLTSVGLDAAVSVGARFYLSSTTTPALDGMYECSGNSTTNVITITPALPSASAETDLVLSSRSSVGVTGATATSSTVITLTDIELLVPFGITFYLASATEAGSDGYYICSDDSTPGQITIDPPLTDVATVSETDITLTTTLVVRAANKTPKTATIRTKVEGEGDVPFYYYDTGCKFTGASIDVPNDGIVTGTINVMGMTETASATPFVGESVTKAAQYSILSAASSIGTVVVSGIVVGTCSFTSLGLQLSTKAQEKRSLSSDTSCGIVTMGIEATSSVEFYFRNLDLYNLFSNATNFAIAFNLIDTDGNAIGITLPYCKIESLEKPVTGKDAFLMETGSIRALKHPTENTNVILSFVDKI